MQLSLFAYMSKKGPIEQAVLSNRCPRCPEAFRVISTKNSWALVVVVSLAKASRVKGLPPTTNACAQLEGAHQRPPKILSLIVSQGCLPDSNWSSPLVPLYFPA